MNTMFADASASLSAVRKEWGWFLAIGIGLVLLGVAAIFYQSTSTITSVIVLGTIVFAAGIVQLFLAFQARGAGHVILALLVGGLDVVVGFALMQHPGAGALLVTLILAVYLIFSGVSRIFYALWLQFPQYGWAAFSGLVSVALGILLWAQWPVSAFWFIGFAVGVNFIFLGMSLSAFAFRLRSTQ